MTTGEQRGETAGAGGEMIAGRITVKFLRAGAAAFALASCLALAACGGRGAQQQKSSAPPKSDFELSLDTVRRGSYVKVYVIRRADNQPLTKEDKDFLRLNTPMETGMWVVTKDGSTAIAGAGFEFEPKHLDALSTRFTVEDYTNK